MTILNRTIQPEIQEIKKLDLINPVNEILTNRLPVYIMEGGTQDIIRIEFIFNAGIRQQHSPLEAELTNKMLLSGTFLMTANEIADKIDFYGAFVETTTDYDSASLNIVTLVKYLEPVMSIVSDVIINATYPIEEFNIMIKNEKQKYEVNNKKVNYVAKQHFDEIIFGKMHPYGM
ncbi:MAG: hypothetical protein Q8880_10395, partial [Bacteroidota bacterium]|nr:hypothetical protein [Bacteroidota bacterium]